MKHGLWSMLIAIIFIIIYLIYIYKYNWKSYVAMTEPGCFTEGCGEVCRSNLNKSYGDQPPGFNPISGGSASCEPSDECFGKVGECIHYGDACGWKQTPALAECLARARGGSAYNALRFTRADCKIIMEQCDKNATTACITGYRDYCRVMFRDLNDSRRRN